MLSYTSRSPATHSALFVSAARRGRYRAPADSESRLVREKAEVRRRVQSRAFSTSRISSSRISDRVGAGGALGASASRRIRRAAALPTQNTTKAMIAKLISALMKRPMLTVGAPAFWAASRVG